MVPNMPDATILKEAVVTTLENRPNTSCKLDVFPTCVLRTLGIQVRGSERKRIIANLNRVIGDLKRARIVEEYKATNRRVRLSMGYKKRWDALLKRTRQHNSQSFQGELWDTSTALVASESRPDIEEDFEEDLEATPIIRSELSLPPLPEARYKPESMELSDEDRAPISLTDEEQSILDAFLDRNDGTDDYSSDGPQIPEKVPVEDDELWRRLGDALSGQEDFAVECLPEGMQVLFATCIGTDVVEIGSPNGNNHLEMKSFLPFREGVALHLLHLTADPAWASIPSVTDVGGLLTFALRRSIHATGVPVSEIAAQVISFISEVKRARLVISGER